MGTDHSAVQHVIETCLQCAQKDVDGLKGSTALGGDVLEPETVEHWATLEDASGSDPVSSVDEDPQTPGDILAFSEASPAA